MSKRKVITLAMLEAAHARSNNPGYYRACARRLSAKLGEACPAWALVRTRDSHGCFAPAPRATPSQAPVAVSVQDQIAALEILRTWRSKTGYRCVVAKHDGSVELWDSTPGARVIARFNDACDAALSVARGDVEWKPLPPPAHMAGAHY